MRKGVLLVLIPLLVSCVSISHRRPAWIDRPYDGKFPEKEYLLVVGSGSSHQKAVDNARINLAAVFSSRVEAFTRITTIDSSDGEAFDELFEQGTVSSSVEDLVGSEVVSSYTDELGQTYVRLAVDRKESARFLRTRLSELTKELEQVRLQSSTDRLERYRLLLGAYPVAREAQQLSDRIWVLTDELNPDFLTALRSELRSLARSISVEVLVHSETDPHLLKAGFEEALQNLGFSQDGGDYTLTIIYESEPVVFEASPYAYERYQLSVTLGRSDMVVRSFTLSERIAALEQRDAEAKALQSALHDGIETLIGVLSQ
ncbi:MAG: hypothetical protein GX911_05695 [Spirochaetales bacterium]|nr:hypothetical protein [Spirochaetales bacterium]